MNKRQFDEKRKCKESKPNERKKIIKRSFYFVDANPNISNKTEVIMKK